MRLIAYTTYFNYGLCIYCGSVYALREHKRSERHQIILRACFLALFNRFGTFGFLSMLPSGVSLWDACTSWGKKIPQRHYFNTLSWNSKQAVDFLKRGPLLAWPSWRRKCPIRTLSELKLNTLVCKNNVTLT